MNIIRFKAPPLPHYIICGQLDMQPGARHLNRTNLGVFDLLVVMEGCLYLGEEDQRFDVAAGHAVILLPDRHHYPTRPCRELTRTYWLHFGTTGEWSVLDGTSDAHREMPPEAPRRKPSSFHAEPFDILIPQFMELSQPERVYETLRMLEQLNPSIHLGGARWSQQLLFQELLRLLAASSNMQRKSPATLCAQKAASWLRQHYREAVTARELGEALNFHPVYIARCMQKEFGCSPMEYLMRIRIQQAKLLLLQTGEPIARIAEQVGFRQPSYFSSCFQRLEGISPRQYRQRFSFTP